MCIKKKRSYHAGIRQASEFQKNGKVFAAGQLEQIQSFFQSVRLDSFFRFLIAKVAAFELSEFLPFLLRPQPVNLNERSLVTRENDCNSRVRDVTNMAFLAKKFSLAQKIFTNF